MEKLLTMRLSFDGIFASIKRAELTILVNAILTIVLLPKMFSKHPTERT